MWKKLTLLTLTAVVVSQAQTLTFKRRGQNVKQVSLEDIPKVLKVDAEPVRVWEPHEAVEKTYRGFNFNALLKAAYGNDWLTTEEILFTCVDGYQPSLPIEKFKQQVSYLTYELPGGAFKVNNKAQNEKEVALGPFYLVWENIKNLKAREDGAQGWPYQVTTVDLIQFSDRFPNMAPASASPAQVKRGFMAFRQNCMTCHTINGEGGAKSVELNYPTSVTEYMKEAWLEKWITEPTSVRFNSNMPSFKSLKSIKDIVAYLKAMAKQKRAPKKT